MKSLFDISDKVFAVTGAAGVLGGGTAHYLQEQGAYLIYLVRSNRVDETRAKAEKISDKYCVLVCDVLDAAAIEAACQQIEEKIGRIDGLINAAGGNQPGATILPEQDVFELKIEDYSQVLDLNLKGTIMPTLKFAKLFKAQGYGCVVNFSSMAASHAITRVMGYSNAKAAIDNFTRWMASELALKYGDQFRVNAIAPGFFIGKQNRALLLNEAGNYTERGQQIINKTPFRRFGKQDEVYGTVHYLISDASAFVTGTVIPVDGGFSSFSGV